MIFSILIPIVVAAMILSVFKAGRAAGATTMEIGPPFGKYFIWGFGLMALGASYLAFTDPTVPMPTTGKFSLAVFGIACLCLRRTASAAENGLFLVMGFLPWKSVTAFEWKDDKTLLVTAAGKQRRVVVRSGVRQSLDSLLRQQTSVGQPA